VDNPENPATFNEETQQCQATYLEIGAKCSNITTNTLESPNPQTCGTSASCIDNHCKCIFGHVQRTPTSPHCEPAICGHTMPYFQCVTLDSNSECNNQTTCVCKQDYELDSQQEKCIPVVRVTKLDQHADGHSKEFSLTSGWMLAVWLAICVVVMVAIVAISLFVVKRNRSARFNYT